LQPDEIKEAFFDASERPKNRPKRRQRRYYSGKKKRHTLKNQFVVVRKRKRAGRRKAKQKEKRRLRVAAVSATRPGQGHGKKLHHASRTTAAAGGWVEWGDAPQRANLRRPDDKQR